MKQIIDGKLYDTDTANLVASGGRAERSSLLYKTKRGVFFRLYHVLGSYSFKTGWEPEHDVITPLSIAAAKEWYEKMDRHIIG